MIESTGPPPPSIRRRLLSRALATVLIGAVISAIAAALTVSAVVRAVMESALEETAQALVVLAEHEAEVEAIAHGRALPALAHQEQLLWQLRTSSGRLIARSHSAPDEPWSVPLAEGHRKAMGLAVYTIPGQDLWLQVAQPLAEFQHAQFMAAISAGGTVLLLGLLASAILGWNIRSELRPIADLARAVDRIDPESSALAPPRSLRSELIPAYRALNALLQRLQAKLRSERAFAAHAAHSLRTPLAGLSAQLEVASATAPPELAPRLAMATLSARHLAGVIDALLMMARATDRICWRTFDATELATVATGRQIEVDSSQLSAASPLYGDSDLLAVAVANLVDNAARHGAHRVHIRAKLLSDLQCIEIEDDGPGVPKRKLAQLQAALERFEQSGEIDSALGLGLTLAFSVARAHKGCISLDCTSAERQGFCAQLKWPLTPDAAAGQRTHST